VQRALDVAGIICRYTLAVLACVWFIQFLFLIGQSADQSQELAGMAIGRAVICGGAAAIWFYRARKAKQVQKLVEYTLHARQSASPVQLNVTPPHIPTEQIQMATPPNAGPKLQEIIKMICGGCGKESADDFTFCPYCGKPKIAETVCRACGKESAGEFNFCPHCGEAFVPKPSVIESSNPSPEVQPVSDAPTDESEPIRDGVAGTAVRVGTLVFGAFSAISLLVSIVKGLVPIYLLEAAGWAGIAWYWQGKKTHSDVAKAIVIVLAVLVAIGEVVHIAFQPDSKSTAPTASDPFAAYGGHEVAPAEASAASHVADVEKQAVALFSQKQYKEARLLFEQACDGTDENGFKYAGFDGEMKACNYLGYLYAQGLGGPHETKKARDAYQKACDQGILPSCASLGTLYQDAGESGNARKYFQKACDGGVAEACGLLRGVQ
jgi:ribosomal protein L32